MQIKVTETQKLKESLHLLLVGVWGGACGKVWSYTAHVSCCIYVINILKAIVQ